MALSPTRWGGWVGLVAGVMFLLAGILILMAPPQTLFNSFSDYVIEVILVGAFGLTLVTVVGLYTLQRGRYGPLGAAGSLLTFIGYALIAVITAVSILVGGEVLFAVRLIAALTVVIGSILLGAMTLHARVLPWWCGVLLMVGFPLGDVLDGIVARGSEAIVLGILWGLVGYALLSSSRVPNQQPSRVS
jgi:hypothetical protein